MLSIVTFLMASAFSFAQSEKTSHAPPTFQVEIKKDGQSISNAFNKKWSFIKVDSDAEALFAVVTIEASGGRFRSIKGQHLLVQDGWLQGNQATIALGAMKSDLDVEFEDGRHQTWTAEVILDKTALISKGCAKAGLSVVSNSPQAPPIFFGAQCVQKENKVIFNPSVPGDVEWGVTTIFETSGKGERWKIFEISKNNMIAGNNVFAVLGFEWNSTKLSFSVVQARKKGTSADDKKAKKKKSEMLRSRVDLGEAQFTSKTTSAQNSSTGPYVAAHVLTPEFLWGLRAWGSIRYAFPLSKGSFSEINGALGYLFGTLNPGTSNYGVFLDYIALNQSQEGTVRNLSLQHNQIGAAFLWIQSLSATADLSVALKYHGAGGGGTGYMAEVAYEGITDGSPRWGAVVHYGAQTVNSAITGTSTFNQMTLSASLSF